jgi:membrane protein DedA with SNARE-associated domain/actin-like ATPase involved in cell morphogenesis
MNILGLRIGNTNTSAFVTTGEHPEPRPVLFDGEPFLPTAAVLRPDGSTLVGKAALDYQLTDPGAEFLNLPEAIQQRLPSGIDHPFENLSISFLRAVKGHTESFIQGKIHQCILSVPAAYDLSQRDFLKFAFTAADLVVAKIILDPEAAMFGADPSETISSALVVRMGGTSTEVARLHRRSPWQVVSHNGDLRLGGRDIDEALTDWFLAEQPEEVAQHLRSDPQALLWLRRKAEQAKIRLTVSEQTQMGPIYWQGRELTAEISRQEFERLLTPHIQKVQALVEHNLEQATDPGRPGNDLDAVLLTGGCAAIPPLKQAMEKIVGSEVKVYHAPPLIMAYGAACVAAMEASEQFRQESRGRIIDLLSRFYLNRSDFGVSESTKEEFQLRLFNLKQSLAQRIPDRAEITSMLSQLGGLVKAMEKPGPPFPFEIWQQAVLALRLDEGARFRTRILDLLAEGALAHQENQEYRLRHVITELSSICGELRHSLELEYRCFQDRLDEPSIRTAEGFSIPGELEFFAAAKSTPEFAAAHPEPVFPMARPRPHLDENVQFTVYRPRLVAPEIWYPLVAFAHLTERRPDAPPEEPDPLAEVKRQAEQVLAEKLPSYQELIQDSKQGLPREGELTFLPEIPGFEVNPPRRTFLWMESVHREEFRLRAPRELDGQLVRGRLSVFLGSILVAEIPLNIEVNSRKAAATPEPRLEKDPPARPYRKIFASYSHKDMAIVTELEQYSAGIGLGDRYLRDLVDLRAGEEWNPALMTMIREANIFQLFWSRNSMVSAFVEEEWRYALSLRRSHFVRPVFWEEPLPEVPERNLPPEDLRRLQFVRIYPRAASAGLDGHPPDKRPPDKRERIRPGEQAYWGIDTKTCPVCGERIGLRELVCPICGERFSTTAPPTREEKRRPDGSQRPPVPPLQERPSQKRPAATPVPPRPPAPRRHDGSDNYQAIPEQILSRPSAQGGPKLFRALPLISAILVFLVLGWYFVMPTPTGLTETLCNYATAILQHCGYLGIFILMTLESLIAPVPSELVMPFAGFLIFTGSFDPLWVMAAGSLGSICGSLLSYGLGVLGEPAVLRYGRYLLLNQRHLEWTKNFFHRHGGKAVFIARFIPGVRRLISIPAGAARMPLPRFLIYTAVGATLWNGLLAYGGVRLGEHWPLFQQYTHILDYMVAACLLGGLAYFVWKFQQSRQSI